MNALGSQKRSSKASCAILVAVWIALVCCQCSPGVDMPPLMATRSDHDTVASASPVAGLKVDPGASPAAPNSLPQVKIVIAPLADAQAAVTEASVTSETSEAISDYGSLAASLRDLCWVAYAPTSFDPDAGVFPDQESIKQDLLTLQQAGFTGLVTYGADQAIHPIAQDFGFGGMIVGVWDPTSVDEIEKAKKAAQYDAVIGYVVGNEGLNQRYDLATLKAAMDDLRSATRKPVATTEQLEDYDDPLLMELGDWVFPNVHPFWNGVVQPEEAAQWTVERHREFMQQTCKPVLFKEVGLPTDGFSGLSQVNQAIYFQELDRSAVDYVRFEAFDQPWKDWAPVEPHWGLFNQDRSPKLAASQACPASRPTLSDEAMLDQIQQRAVLYFWQQANAETGLVKDRANNFGSDDYTVASIAATGFGLAALTIGESHGWLTYDEAYQRTLATLHYLRDDMPNEHGFYYHFVDANSGQRVWESEVSSIDTAWLLAGILMAREYFKGTEVEEIADELYRRVDFQWMLTDDGQRPNELLLSHGWTPEGGFLPSRWDSYNELMLLYLLAIGSPTHPIPAASWEAWSRPEAAYGGYTTYAIGPLFTHQFSQAWVNFRSRMDRLGYNYWQSSVNATLANRQFCIDNPEGFQTYGADVWGLTASDGPQGYQAYGAPPGAAIHDGTVSPAAPAGSIVFTPELSLAALQAMYERYGDRIWGRYGFSNAFNVDQDWWDQDVIGIDQGITLLMIENYRSALVWRTLQRNEHVEAALYAVGLGLQG